MEPDTALRHYPVRNTAHIRDYAERVVELGYAPDGWDGVHYVEHWATSLVVAEFTRRLQAQWDRQPNKPKGDIWAIRPEPPYAITQRGRLTHRTKMLIGLTPVDPGASRTTLQTWCGQTADGNTAIFKFDADFVCGACEKAAIKAGMRPTTALPESGCEAWHGTRFTKQPPT